MTKKVNYKWEGFKGAAIFFVLLVFLNFFLGGITTGYEIESLCTEDYYYDSWTIERDVFRTRDTEWHDKLYCFSIPADFLGGGNPKYLGEIRCQAKTFFWESKQCVLISGES